MTWARLDDRFGEHPKVVALSDVAFRVHVMAICYCARNLTDGFVPAGAARLMGATPKTLRALVEAGLWAHACGGYRIHDYLDYNPSKAEVEDAAAKRSEAARIAGNASAEARQRKRQRTVERTVERFGNDSATIDPTDFNPVPDPVPLNATKEPIGSFSAGGAAPPAAVPKRPPRGVFRPLTDEQRAGIEAENADIPDIAEIIAEALDHEAARKRTDMNLYVRRWVARERARRGNGHQVQRGNQTRNGRGGRDAGPEDPDLERILERARREDAELERSAGAASS